MEAKEAAADRVRLLPEPADDARPYATRLAEALAQGIVDRILRQGERMPAAAQLAARFGCKVDVARHAVRLLSDHGLVVREAGGFAYVRGALAVPDFHTEQMAIAARRRGRPARDR